jgi:hypothetical protein
LQGLQYAGVVHLQNAAVCLRLSILSEKYIPTKIDFIK